MAGQMSNKRLFFTAILVVLVACILGGLLGHWFGYVGVIATPLLFSALAFVGGKVMKK